MSGKVEFCSSSYPWVNSFVGKIELASQCKTYQELCGRVKADMQEYKMLRVDAVSLRDRYGNVTPFQTNQVVLNDNTAMNASRIVLRCTHDFAKLSPEYLAMSAPLPTHFFETMKMVAEESVGLIINLTEYKEFVDTKAHPYLPELDEKEKMISQCNKPENSVTISRKTLNEVTELKGGMRLEKSRHALKIAESTCALTYFHFRHWQDQTGGVPSAIIKVAKEAIAFERAHPDQKILIHCSAGIGRTGTFLAVMQMLKEQEEYGSTNIHMILYQLAMQRVSLAINSLDQYRMLFELNTSTPGR